MIECIYQISHISHLLLKNVRKSMLGKLSVLGTFKDCLLTEVPSASTIHPRKSQKALIYFIIKIKNKVLDHE